MIAIVIQLCNHPLLTTSGGRASFASIAKASSNGMTTEFCDPRRRIETVRSSASR
ncbi:MAG: hypothetical protein IOC90_16920, partial [Methylocystis sp.]|nr:hypothetical protein [Methylocystis sp.]